MRSTQTLSPKPRSGFVQPVLNVLSRNQKSVTQRIRIRIISQMRRTLEITGQSDTTWTIRPDWAFFHTCSHTIGPSQQAPNTAKTSTHWRVIGNATTSRCLAAPTASTVCPPKNPNINAQRQGVSRLSPTVKTPSAKVALPMNSSDTCRRLSIALIAKQTCIQDNTQCSRTRCLPFLARI